MPIAKSGWPPVPDNEKDSANDPPVTRKVGRGDPPANWVSVFGFVIVTKADLLAASAFLLSLMTVIYQTSIWLEGPRPRLYTPDTVYIFFDQYANNRTVTRFAGQLSFLNLSPPNHDAIVEKVELTAVAGTKGVHEVWLNIATVRRDGKQLIVDAKDQAHPFIISSGSAISELYSFAPQERDCGAQPRCNTDGNFVDDLMFLRALGEAKELRLTFEVHYVGRKDVQQVACRIVISPGIMVYLAENGWYAARCLT